MGLDRTRLFIRGGKGAQIGMSRRLADGEHHVSVGTGLWAVYTRENQFRFGIVHRSTMGLGLGYGG